MKAELIIINSRYNLFWFELVAVCNNVIVKTYAQERTARQCEELREQILKEGF